MSRFGIISVMFLIILITLFTSAVSSEEVTLSGERYNELKSEVNRLQDRADNLESRIQSLKNTETAKNQPKEDSAKQNLDNRSDGDISMGETQNLGDIQNVFANRGLDFNLVMGEEANTIDTVAATEVSGYIHQVSKDFGSVDGVQTNQISVEDSRLESNLVLLGGPRVNNLTAKLAVENKTWSSEEYSPGTAIIQYINDGFVTGNDVLVVAGYSGEDTRKAAEFLTKYDQNHERFENKSKVTLNSALN